MKYFTTLEVANELKVSKQTLLNWLYAGKVEAFGTAVLAEIETADLIVSPAVLLEIRLLQEIARIDVGPEEVLAALRRDIGLKVCEISFHEVVRAAVDEAWTILRPRSAHFHVKDYSLKTHKNVPAGQGDGQIPRLIADAVAHGYEGFCVLEPHLVLAEQSYGFTGPERFGDAARALKSALDEKGIAYA